MQKIFEILLCALLQLQKCSFIEFSSAVVSIARCLRKMTSAAGKGVTQVMHRCEAAKASGYLGQLIFYFSNILYCFCGYF